MQTQNGCVSLDIARFGSRTGITRAGGRQNRHGYDLRSYEHVCSRVIYGDRRDSSRGPFAPSHKQRCTLSAFMRRVVKLITTTKDQKGPTLNRNAAGSFDDYIDPESIVGSDQTRRPLARCLASGGEGGSGHEGRQRGSSSCGVFRGGIADTREACPLH